MGSADSATLINLLIVVIGYLWISLALSAVFAKVGESKGSAWVPIWNLAVLLRLGGYSPWLILIPVVGLVLLLIACHRIGLGFGYGSAMTLVAALWFPIWASVLGWGNAVWSGVVKVPSRIWADEPTPLPRVTYVDEPTDPREASGLPSMMAAPPPWTAAPPPPVGANPDSSSALDPADAAEEGNDMIDSDLERTPEPKIVVPKPTPITAVDLVAAAFDRPFDDDFSVAPPRPSSQPPPPGAQAPVAVPPAQAPAAAPVAPAARPQARGGSSAAHQPAPTQRTTARPMPPVSEETTELDQTMLASRFRQQWAIVGRSGDAVVLTGSVAVAGRKPDPMRDYPDAQLVVVPDSSRTVSKAHVLLRLVRGVWMVRDLGSTNGVILVGPDGQERLLAPDREEPLTERFFLGDAEFSLVSNP